jgi:hypothetical protein
MMTLLVLAGLAAIATESWLWFGLVVAIAILFALIKIGSWTLGG